MNEFKFSPLSILTGSALSVGIWSWGLPKLAVVGVAEAATMTTSMLAVGAIQLIVMTYILIAITQAIISYFEKSSLGTPKRVITT